MGAVREALRETVLGDLVRAARRRLENVPWKVTTPEGTVLVAPRKYASWYQRGFEGLTVRWLRSTLQQGEVAVDGGAHVGFLSVLMAKQVGEAGRVLAFEPAPSNLNYLRRNVRLNGLSNVDVVAAALGSESSPRDLSLARSSDSHGFYSHPYADTVGHLTVPQIRLDEHISDADLIKLDVEGAEIDALDGMPHLLSRRPRLLVEWAPACQVSSGRDPAELIHRIRDMDYTIKVLDDVRGRIMDVEDALTELSTVGPTWYANLACIHR